MTSISTSLAIGASRLASAFFTLHQTSPPRPHRLGGIFEFVALPIPAPDDVRSLLSKRGLS
jgi:hypothetical protein